MAVISPQIVGDLTARFQAQFETEAKPGVARAPGRVNLIGEHTDYNLGFVLPIAIEMACYITVAPNQKGELRIYSQDLEREFRIPVDGLENAKPSGEWHDYVVGVARELVRLGTRVDGTDLYIRSYVPAGSGLSSSAALEIATAFALLGGRAIDPLQIALLSQRAESQFVGVPCGIMDQYASVFGHEGAAVQIDCRSLGHQYVELPADVTVLAVNSMVKHELGTSAYRQRVAECKEAVAALQKGDASIQSLRDVSPEFFARYEETLPPIPRKRARHVITDSQRVLDFAAAAKAGDKAEMGRLFVASHRSMQYDYEISCEEIDFLVDTAISLPGVYGARMTGGGFGGCTVNLVAPESVPAFTTRIAEVYKQRYGLDAAVYDCKPAAQAGYQAVS